ncbi:cysteine peptidase family C39 domain-containing protein [Geobacter sp. DSM 9736]|uniref:cysteine peptidase family C39 domain-containing protein n=1 Tax=Geobacter sp. DSM 9736 TaxID=1277350 RepID=UPI000B61F246|nr:cysteine peptidase family C39 domain-containing protein [Geobacter sp. DSM 9736]SNB45245.1 Peptidase C39 family protein [Geobacter sp. DSM 9736]
MKNEEPRVVVQEDATGCGIACAAMLAGKTYHAAKRRAKELSLFSDDRNLSSDISDLRPLLESYNIRIGRKTSFRNWNEVPSPSILAVKHKAGAESECWHWTVFHRRENGPVILDPDRNLKSNVRRDLARLKPKWYIPVGPSQRF